MSYPARRPPYVERRLPVLDIGNVAQLGEHLRARLPCTDDYEDLIQGKDNQIMSKRLLADVAERAGWTFLQSFLGILLALPVLDVHVSSLKVAAASALPAALAVVKGFAASRIGTGQTAATFPVEQ